MESSDNYSRSANAADHTSEKKKKKEGLDLSKLDEKSVKIMVMLMVNLLQLDMTTQDFFRDVIFE